VVISTHPKNIGQIIEERKIERLLETNNQSMNQSVVTDDHFKNRRLLSFSGPTKLPTTSHIQMWHLG
jgi:hypothetical protein